MRVITDRKRLYNRFKQLKTTNDSFTILRDDIGFTSATGLLELKIGN